MTSATTDQPVTAKTARVCPYCRARPAIRAGNCAECQSTYLAGKPLVTFDGKTFTQGIGPSLAEWRDRTYGPGEGFKSATLLTDEERANLTASTRKTAKPAKSTTEKGATMPKTATAKPTAAEAPTAKGARKSAAVVAPAVEARPAPVTGKRKPSAKPAPAPATAPAQTATTKVRANRAKTAEKAPIAVAPPPAAPPATSDGARATNGHNAPKSKRGERKPIVFKHGQGGTSRDAEVETELFADGMTSQKRSRRTFQGAFDADAVKRTIAAVRRDLDKLESMLSLAAVQPDSDYAAIMRANGVAHVAPAPAPAPSKSTTAKSAAPVQAKQQRTTKAPPTRKPASAAGSGRDVQATLDDVYEYTGVRLPAGRSTRYWLEHWRELKPLVTGSDPAGRNPTRGILPGQDDRLPRTVLADKASGGMTLPALARITGHKNGRALADDIYNTFTYITAVRKYWGRGKG